MDSGNIMLSEISQTQKDKYCMVSLTCGILGRKNKSTHINSRKVVAGGWGGVWENRERLVKGYMCCA